MNNKYKPDIESFTVKACAILGPISAMYAIVIGIAGFMYQGLTSYEQAHAPIFLSWCGSHLMTALASALLSIFVFVLMTFIISRPISHGAVVTFTSGYPSPVTTLRVGTVEFTQD